MTHRIQHQYDEILHAAWPGLEIHVIYYCDSEIVIDDEGEHAPYLLTIRAEINGQQVPAPKFPLYEHGDDTRKFLAKLRESARQALWAKALREAKAAGYKIENAEYEVIEAAENWQRTGKAVLVLERGLSTDND